MKCSYCGERRANQRDHLIKKAQAKRSIAAARERNNPKYIVPACDLCNVSLYTRLFVPESHAHLIPELESLTGGKYRVWHGDAESLREVLK